MINNTGNSKTDLWAKYCPQCNNPDLRLKISASLDIPKELFKQLTKELFLEKDVKIAILWDNHIIYCPLCNWFLDVTIP